MGSTFHFTGDAPRMLIAERSGRGRWFDLNSGVPAESRNLGQPEPTNFHRITSASDSGAVLGSTGPVAGKGNGSAVLDGKAGKALRVFHKRYHTNSPVAVSADGRRAALIHTIDRDAITVDVLNLSHGARVGRAKRALPADGPATTTAPRFALAPDGRALVVYDPPRNRAHLFAVPSGKAP